MLDQPLYQAAPCGCIPGSRACATRLALVEEEAAADRAYFEAASTGVDVDVATGVRILVHGALDAHDEAARLAVAR